MPLGELLLALERDAAAEASAVLDAARSAAEQLETSASRARGDAIARQAREYEATARRTADARIAESQRAVRARVLAARAAMLDRVRAEIAARLRTSPLSFSRHLFVKPQIQVGGDRATGRWDILAPCTFADGSAKWMSGVEDDVYARGADGVWRHERMTLTTVFLAPSSDGWGRIFT